MANDGENNQEVNERPQDLARREATEAIDSLFREAFDLKDEGSLSSLFDYLGSVSRYSLFNLKMAKLQRPGCGAIATPKRWMELGRNIKPGSLPIIILRPGGPIMPVYDVSDTDGPELPDDWMKIAGRVTETDYERLKRKANQEDGVEVRVLPLGYLQGGDISTSHGILVERVQRTENDIRFRVRIAEHLETEQRFATLVHELAHLYCGHLGADTDDPWFDRSSGLTRGEREFEAEGTTFLVTKRAGLETRAANYLTAYAADCDTENLSIDTMIWAASRIEKFWRPTSMHLNRW